MTDSTALRPTPEHNPLNGASADYVAALYTQFLQNAGSIDSSWSEFFTQMNDDQRNLLDELRGASWNPSPEVPLQRAKNDNAAMQNPNLTAETASAAIDENEFLRRAVLDSVNAIMMIRAYRVRGHLEASLDPLGLDKREDHPELDPEHFGFTVSDYDRPVFLNGYLGIQYASLRDLTKKLRIIYCGSIGVEFMHIQDPEQKSWIQRRIEAQGNATTFSERRKAKILENLTHAEDFEKFLHKKFTGTKRFGLDGGEATIAAIEEILRKSTELGVVETVLGMAHRGRLNVLANVMKKPFSAIFAEFLGKNTIPKDIQASGDVKYHLGTSADRDFEGRPMHLSLTANPSHLEAVNSVVLGKVRAKQLQHQDPERDKVMGLLLHGDAAVAGQGPVAESLHLSELKGYRTGGTMHIVINNQIGFTTTPKYARSSPYPTDCAKMIQAPIFHVNGDDAEAVVHVARIAAEFRQKFNKDVFLDIVCYRRFGHNEGDEPAFTQPLMYKAIKTQTSVRTKYAAQLVEEGLMTAAQTDQVSSDFQAHLEDEFNAAENFKPGKADMFGGVWSGFQFAGDGPNRGKTAVTQKVLKEIGKALTTVPDDFTANSKILRQLKAKAEMFDTGQGFDWATAEAMAFGALLLEGHEVRLSGQDCGRGTFSQRHAVLYDQETKRKYRPLRHIREDQAFFEVLNSPLSEAAVMGFEYGFSLAEPSSLVMWEGQFGDFANGAQVMIDQFIASGEAKWLRSSGLVLLLPHGYEGQGPEHSSARLERFLQMSAEENWQVANCTTPANYFHILRRQLKRNFRKPLVLMTPKSLLRHKLCVSPLSMFSGNETFHRVLDERDVKGLAADKKIKRIVFCSGKVYYDLFQAREAAGAMDVSLIRLEQLYPFPADVIAEVVKAMPKAEIIWCQEEPQNMGAWQFVDRRFEAVLRDVKHKPSQRPCYVGRAAAASPATGFLSVHNAQQKALVEEALGIK